MAAPRSKPSRTAAVNCVSEPAKSRRSSGRPLMVTLKSATPDARLGPAVVERGEEAGDLRGDDQRLTAWSDCDLRLELTRLCTAPEDDGDLERHLFDVAGDEVEAPVAGHANVRRADGPVIHGESLRRGGRCGVDDGQIGRA